MFPVDFPPDGEVADPHCVSQLTSHILQIRLYNIMIIYILTSIWTKPKVHPSTMQCVTVNATDGANCKEQLVPNFNSAIVQTLLCILSSHQRFFGTTTYCSDRPSSVCNSIPTWIGKVQSQRNSSMAEEEI